MSRFQSRCTRVLTKLRPSAMFLTISSYHNNEGEVADHSVCFHISYENALIRSHQILSSYIPSEKDCEGRPFNPTHLEIAKAELLESYEMSLGGYNPLATSAHAYDEIVNGYGEPIKGVKLHMEEDVLHIYGYRISKRVLKPTVYRRILSSPKTLAKNFLRKKTPLSKFGQFKLVPGRFKRIRVQEFTIRQKDVLRELIVAPPSMIGGMR